MYEFGRGFAANDAEAAKWYRRAAEQGHVVAQFHLGNMYHRGEGVAEDHAEAVRWYRRAAEQGHTIAQLRLGAMYALGKGIPQHFLWAYVWTNLAASQLTGLKREKAVKIRDSVSGILSKSELGRAQRMAEEWQPKVENE